MCRNNRNIKSYTQKILGNMMLLFLQLTGEYYLRGQVYFQNGTTKQKYWWTRETHSCAYSKSSYYVGKNAPASLHWFKWYLQNKLTFQVFLIPVRLDIVYQMINFIYDALKDVISLASSRIRRTKNCSGPVSSKLQDTGSWTGSQTEPTWMVRKVPGQRKNKAVRVREISAATERKCQVLLSLILATQLVVGWMKMSMLL